MHKFNHFLKEKISLSLEYHNVLNPLIWENEVMKPRVRERLLEIGKLWAEFSHIPEDAIRDIVLTGGNANFNYTPHSDLDIHLMVDMNKIKIGKDLLDEYLYDKKLLWGFKHPYLTVMGYPVELYAQNYRDSVVTHQGMYSLQKDKWLAKPIHEKHVHFLKDKALLKKIEGYIKMFDKVLTEKGDHIAEITKIKEKLHAMRSSGIQKAGEFSMENLIYKDLRNKGYLSKLDDHLMRARDKLLSLQ
jgi:hypothetical protein